MQQFSELGLAEPLLRALSAEGYQKPTPVQAAVVPAMLASKDVIAIAQTGTGKTASFVLPLLDRVAQRRTTPVPRSGKALILVPTRELATQVASSIRAYGRFIRHAATVIVGGVKPGPQVRAMAKGVDIIVATPGRLLDHLTTGALHLRETDIAILDEADQMLDLGFMPAIRKILGQIEGARQTVLLSATMPTPIRRLARDLMKEPVEISLTPAARPIERIDQRALQVAGPAKRQALIDILAGQDVGRAIVFTRTKRGADKVNADLQKAGLVADALHGNKSQGQRQRTLACFRSGKVKVLVATDIAARGIDVDDVSHVVNYELPDVPEAYVHRIGRTARAGKDGIAISLYDNSERSLLRGIERFIGRKLDDSSDDAAPAGRGDAKALTRRSKGVALNTPPKPRRRAGNHRGKSKAEGSSSVDSSHARQGRNARRGRRSKTVDRQAHRQT